jgi:branched-chain amino acid transport system ATP-binding protein
VEQDVESALRVAARAYVLETGRIVVSGVAEDVLTDSRVQDSYLGLG